jgi:EF hand
MSVLSLVPFMTLALGLTFGSPMPQENGHRGSGDATKYFSMDRNHDGVITRGEWRGSDQSFRQHDWNGDRMLSGDELRPGASRPLAPHFTDWTELGFRVRDFNSDGRLSRGEWFYDIDTFSRMDLNRDGFVSHREFLEAVDADPEVQRSQAYLAGSHQGAIEGRQAGREDRTRRNAWDLEGQRELEQADSGYTTHVGLRSDYQAGYRARFRRAYAEGFGTP